MCLAFVAAYFALEAEIKRRKLGFTAADLALDAEAKRRKLVKIDAYSVIAYTAIAGILGAKLWHVIDTPDDRLTSQILFSPSALLAWFRGGFAWFGGFLAGIATLLLLARRYRVNWLTMLDIASPAVAIGYAVGRIGCLISGDGDYGQPTHLPWGMAFPNGLVPTTGSQGICLRSGWPENCAVHPTPIYEFAVGMLIFWYLWRRGARAIRHPLAPGVITGEFLILSGLARFLVEFIRINPRVFLGMSNAQVSALLTAVAGIILLLIVRRRFRKVDPVHKVLDHVTQHGNQETRPEYHRATAECPNPERWRRHPRSPVR
jgi:phosphatidylglycerol:prolipoprotein diacylglycerol transferase